MYIYGFQNSAKVRLETYRKNAAEWKAKYPESVKTWKDYRWPKPNTIRMFYQNSYSDDGLKWFLDDFECGPFNGADKAYDVLNTYYRPDCTGYYADNFQDSVIEPMVVELKTSRGPIFYPATQCSGWDGVTIYKGDAFPADSNSEEDRDYARKEAAKRVYHYAEKEAEQSREDDAKYQAEQQIQELKTEYHEINKETLDKVRILKSQSDLFEIKSKIAYLIDLESICEERKEKMDKIIELKANPWNAVPNW